MVEHRLKKRIDGVEYGLLSPDMIRKMSVCEITNPETYDTDGYPAEGGLMDLRLGVIDPGLKCKTCGSRMGDCPGHFGHMELIRPVMHVGYAKDAARILKSICPSCGRIMLNEKQIKHYKKEMGVVAELSGEIFPVVKEISVKASAVDECPYCGVKSEKIKFEKPYSFRQDKKKLSAVEVRDLLEKVKNEDLPLLGFDINARPEWTVITVLPVPSVTVRPSIILATSERSEDDLTHKLLDVIRINRRLRENIDAGAPELIIEDLWELLQYHVTTYFDNECSAIPPARHSSGRPLRTLAQRWKGKEGRMRHNILGKRVNFSARAVISPDPSINIDEVGLPYEIAMELTVPMVLTERNLEKAKEFIMNGPMKWPGANYLLSPDGTKRKIIDENKGVLAELAKPGYTIERHLMDGDPVLFNRQPSLHRVSMMTHFVRVLPGKTIRIHPITTAPYNADFDGDEMNVHVPQSPEAKAEAVLLTQVKNRILSPNDGSPLIKGMKDIVSGGWLFSKHKFTREQAVQILWDAVVDPTLLPEQDEYMGRDLLSTLLPKTFNMTYKESWCDNCAKCKKKDCEKNAYVEIRKGRMMSGYMGNRFISKDVLSSLFKEYGADMTKDFLYKGSLMILRGLRYIGFSHSPDELNLPEEMKEEFQAQFNEVIGKMNDTTKRYDNGTLQSLPGMSARETLDWMILDSYGKFKKKAFKLITNTVAGKGNIGAMLTTGESVTTDTVLMLSAAVGQQSLRGSRVYKGYESERCLPSHQFRDYGLRSRGFVASSHRKGLEPDELFFVGVGGRSGIVEKAVSTQNSGYFYRRLVNALQDLVVQEDYTVRDIRGNVVQFYYGEDGTYPVSAGALDLKRIASRIKGD